jgi:hypothetical protein
MNKVLKITIVSVLANIALAVLWIIPSNYAKNENGLGWFLFGFMISGAALFIQLLLGIIFAAGQVKKDMGKGLLLATGICLLIGLSYCGALMF